MRHFTCTCGNALFFENTSCLQCGSEVGFDPHSNNMTALQGGGQVVRCLNGIDHGVCNWLVPAIGDNPFCPACSLNKVIPDLSAPGNVTSWARMESAKRRVLYTLRRIGHKPVSRAVDPAGLCFEFLAPVAGNGVLTGHDDGTITINLLEADDLYREQQRHQLGEPYRTLVGHFRHEIGHYYWDRFFLWRTDNDPVMQEWRSLFGDEREDYEEALKRHYANGASPNWPATHISAYATMHPWEDWAETWAHYLHMLDGVETAAAFGWTGDQIPLPFTPFLAESVIENQSGTSINFLGLLNSWARLSPALNEIAASLGHRDLYPFVLSQSSVRKMHFVDRVTRAAAAEASKLQTPLPVS